MSEEMVFTDKKIVVKTPIQKELAKIKGYESVRETQASSVEPLKEVQEPSPPKTIVLREV